MTFSPPTDHFQKIVNEHVVIEQLLIFRNSVLELDHVTNVTIVRNKTAASDWGSRCMSVT